MNKYIIITANSYRELEEEINSHTNYYDCDGDFLFDTREFNSSYGKDRRYYFFQRMIRRDSLKIPIESLLKEIQEIKSEMSKLKEQLVKKKDEGVLE